MAVPAKKLLGLCDVTPTAWHGNELAEVTKGGVVRWGFRFRGWPCLGVRGRSMRLIRIRRDLSWRRSLGLFQLTFRNIRMSPTISFRLKIMVLIDPLRRAGFEVPVLLRIQ